MPVWESLIELVRELLFLLAHALGGSFGTAIATLAIAVRVALLPLTVRVAVRMHDLRSRLRAIQPEVDRLRARYGGDQARLGTRLRELYARNGIRLVPRGSVLSMAVQLPIGLALYQAIASGLPPGSRFLWITDLARPDGVIATITAALTAGGVAWSSTTPGASPHPAAIALAAAVSLAVVWRLAAGVGIYWAASTVVGLGQSWLTRRVLANRVG